MFLQRQISASCVLGEFDSLADATKFPYKLVDVLPKYILNLEPGKFTSDYIDLDATDTFSVPLPTNYTTGERLSCVFRSNNICKLVIVSPDHGTSTFLLKSTSSAAQGDHKGIIMWQGSVTSITVSVPATFDPALIEYFIWEIPDLSLASSWKLGDMAIGYVTNEDSQ
jgi:hypothetical protein